jgi:hypothetical protein
MFKVFSEKVAVHHENHTKRIGKYTLWAKCKIIMRYSGGTCLWAESSYISHYQDK